MKLLRKVGLRREKCPVSHKDAHPYRILVFRWVTKKGKVWEKISKAAPYLFKLSNGKAKAPSVDTATKIPTVLCLSKVNEAHLEFPMATIVR